MDEVANYCQDWHPDGSPRTIVTVRNGVKSVTTLPAKPPQSQASIRANYWSKAQAEIDPKMIPLALFLLPYVPGE